MSEADERICRTPGCGGPPSGVCLEKFSFEECPFLRPEAEHTGTSGAEADEESADPAPELVRTGAVAHFDATDCDAFLRMRTATVVALVAAPEVGKTTMMSTLYELIRRGKLEGFGFAGSETIRGLEERCFLSRAKSENAKPDTQHTSARAGLNFTHVTVATAAGRQELILSDRSGEHFQRVLDNPGTIADFAELERATVTLLLVDGEQLVLSRHRPTAEARRLFMALAQAGLAVGRPMLLVATKRDLVPEERMGDLDEALAELLADLRRRAPGAALQAYSTGARPRQGPEFGEGFDALTAGLLPKPAPHVFETAIPDFDGHSALERLVRPLARRGA